MAGDWIKMRTALADDPAVIAMADALDTDEFSVVGRLHHLWSWADAQSRDGHAPGVTCGWINRYVRCDRFAEAMISVNWLVAEEGGIRFPNFDRHNGETAKARGLATNRKQKQRASVTEESIDMSRSERDESVTREEKRREEENQRSSNGSSEAPRAGENDELPLAAAEISVSLIGWERSRNKAARGISASNQQVIDLCELKVTRAELRKAYDAAVADRLATDDPNPVNAGFIRVFVEKVRNPPKDKPKQDTWYTTPAGIERKASELGIYPRAGETHSALAERCRSAINQLEHAA